MKLAEQGRTAASGTIAPGCCAANSSFGPSELQINVWLLSHVHTQQILKHLGVFCFPFLVAPGMNLSPPQSPTPSSAWRMQYFCASSFSFLALLAMDLSRSVASKSEFSNAASASFIAFLCVSCIAANSSLVRCGMSKNSGLSRPTALASLRISRGAPSRTAAPRERRLNAGCADKPDGALAATACLQTAALLQGVIGADFTIAWTIAGV
eukprot:CAMPEP_0117662880 /NCGR_PEP_ID=MMETSP0804-20121206/8286_1 /TAXON_ID=1074897 /ORGANISM="Tetraselmis astigmatica, Strain CCMP880" /LENGTH=209 /DNA_ID=CAMNT_0005469803 /DNA_START=61 /DNA_END=691 /DNA_ORIENTATION=+